MTKTSRKIRARAKELSNLIAIDVMAADMFELNPLTEYDFYMRSFGNSNTRQVIHATRPDQLTCNFMVLVVTSLKSQMKHGQYNGILVLNVHVPNIAPLLKLRRKNYVVL